MPDSTPCTPTDTSGDPCIPPDLPPNFSKWNREHVRVFLQANQEDYGLDEEDIDYIYGNKIIGRDFAKLTEEKLVAFYKLPFSVASRIYELITTLTKPLQRVDILVTEKNTQLLSDDAVVLFWRSLFLKHPNYPVINSEWIHLNPKVNWMGSNTYEQSVFIRPIYNKFWEMINGRGRLWILTGTPGIGKTFFTFFMFVKIRMTQPNAIIARMYRDMTLIFYPDGTVYQSSGKVPRKVHQNAENWVIADAVLPADEGMYCRTVLVTSPKMAGYGRHRKQGFQERCMPVWDLEELGKVYTQVYNVSGLAWEDVESSFELWGGIPRTTLRFINDEVWERSLRTAFTANRMEECMKLDGALSYSSVDDVSGMLVHLVPIDDQYIFTEVRWASRKLCAIVLEVLIEQGKRKAKEIILSTRGIGAYGSLQGYLFENLAHEVIAEGGRFQVFDLNTRIWKEEEFPRRKVKQFKQVNEAKPGHHNVPLSQTFQSVDALVPPDILYQMTVSTSHGIKERGLDTLNFTGTYPINFYFVTLIEGCESFKKAKLGNEWDARIKQKVIGINLDDAIPKYQATFHKEVMMILRVKRARVDRADRG